MLRVAGLQRLDRTPLADGNREVRIWLDLALATPQRLVVVRDRDGTVSGDAILYWHRRADEADQLDSLLTARFGPTCQRIERGDEWVVCHAQFRRAPDWERILSDASAAGLWTLPDPFTLPREGWVVLDGWSMTVELRDGEHYRTYQYNNPDSYDWPETRQAMVVQEIFDRPWQHLVKTDSVNRPDMAPNDGPDAVSDP